VGPCPAALAAGGERSTRQVRSLPRGALCRRPQAVRIPRWLTRAAVAVAAVTSAGLVALAYLLLRPGEQPPADAPTPAAPFRPEQVRFASAGNQLAGVLPRPATPGPAPAVVFLTGSGPADRTASGLLPPLWQLFARHGFASLSWDRPGVGRSTGDFERQTFPDRAEEALAAVRFLRA